MKIRSEVCGSDLGYIFAERDKEYEMAVGFRLAKHSAGSVDLVEILIDGAVVGVIYPKGNDGIKLVSAHMHEKVADKKFAGTVIVDDGSTMWPPIPSVDVVFKPSPYVIGRGRIIKLKQ